MFVIINVMNKLNSNLSTQIIMPTIIVGSFSLSIVSFVGVFFQPGAISTIIWCPALLGVSSSTATLGLGTLILFIVSRVSSKDNPSPLHANPRFFILGEQSQDELSEEEINQEVITYEELSEEDLIPS